MQELGFDLQPKRIYHPQSIEIAEPVDHALGICFRRIIEFQTPQSNSGDMVDFLKLFDNLFDSEQAFDGILFRCNHHVCNLRVICNVFDIFLGCLGIHFNSGFMDPENR